MKSSTQDQIKGTFHEVKGTIKQIAGVVSENKQMEQDGANERIAGKVQNKFGQVKKVLGK